MNILLLSGSFHSKSKTLALLHNISSFLYEHELEMPKLDSLPFYSEDLSYERTAIVSDFLLQVESADALLICTPEYNHSIPAVLKNAIDWASRPAFNSPLKDKAVSIITQAASPVGGARAQAHLKLVLDSTLSNIHMCHEMMVTDIDNIFDQNMNILDTKVLTRLERHVNDFIRFANSSYVQSL